MEDQVAEGSQMHHGKETERIVGVNKAVNKEDQNIVFSTLMFSSNVLKHKKEIGIVTTISCL